MGGNHTTAGSRLLRLHVLFVFHLYMQDMYSPLHDRAQGQGDGGGSLLLLWAHDVILACYGAETRCACVIAAADAC